jgi:23S rRNA pseudouridine1911/1915/1917 synthase
MSTTIEQSFIISPEHHGLRLDQALSQLLTDYSRSQIKQWILDKEILVNGQAIRPRDKVQLDDTVTLAVTLKVKQEDKPQDLPLDIVYEDDELLIINKPVGAVVHPGAGNQDSTLLNALLHHYPDIATIPRAGIVHRLDKDTSGLMVIAKTLSSHHYLVDAMQQRLIKREYLAITNGTFISGGTVDEPIGRHPKQRTQMAVSHNGGKPAITHYRLAQKFRAHTYLRVQLETGRTHQIRVHMAHINHALVGDQVYGGRLHMPKGATPELREKLHSFKRQALHATKLTFTHPVNQQEICQEATPPEDFKQLLATLECDNLTKR